MQETNLITRTNSQSGAFPRVTLGWSWLIILPGLVWGTISYYLPLLGGTLDRAGFWIVTLGILLFTGISLACHLLAHLWVAWLTGKKLPSEMTVLVFGEAAQRWPAAGSDAHEILIAMAGPLINLLLAGLAYLVWNGQSNQSINLIALFSCGFNAWLFFINLIPAFPLDGGRVFRGIFRGLFPLPESSTRWGRRLGWIIAAALIGWGIFLILQRSRFSWETGLITFLFVLLMVDGLRLRPAAEIGEAAQVDRKIRYGFVRSLGAGLLVPGHAGSRFQPFNDQQRPGCAGSGAFGGADD